MNSPAHSPAPAAVSLWQLDAARGAAACYIAAGHLCRDKLDVIVPGLRRLLDFGQEAVIVFFLLSGFVIHWSTAHKPGLTFGAYLRARAVRIYPLFLLTLLLGLLLTQRQMPPDPRVSWPVFLGNVLMLQDWGTIKPGVWVDVYAGILVLWSLSYEWWFYMLYFPLSRKINPPRQVWVVAALSLSQAILYLWLPNQLSRFLLYFCIWWTGVELARTKLAGQPLRARAIGVSLGTMALVAAVLGCGVWRAAVTGAELRAGTHPFLELRHFLAALLITGGALAWHRLHWAGFRTLFGGFVRLAPLTYAIYLLHEPIVLHGNPLGFIANVPLQTALNAALVLLVAWLAEHYFQRWCRRLFL